GTALCVASRCVVASCSPGRGDCDGIAANGCEADLTSDPRHCGGCFTSCAGTSGCSAGRCTMTCAPASCASLGRTCGAAADGCGGTLACGGCAAGQTWGTSWPCVALIHGATTLCGACVDTRTDPFNCGACS